MPKVCVGLSTLAVVVLLTACGGRSDASVSSSSLTKSPDVAASLAPGLGEIEKSEQHFTGRCMTSKGWQVTLESDGSITADVPQEQQARFMSDNEACVAIYKSKYPDAPKTRASLKDLYAQELETMKCLQGLGFDVDPPESEQSYIDTYLSGGSPSWFAYAHVVEPGARMPLAEVEKKCPQPKLRQVG